MQKDLQSNASEEIHSAHLETSPLHPLITRIMTESNQFMFGESGFDSRVNEAIQLNTRKLIGLSQKKKYFPPNFFTKPQTKDRAATIYRISYGEDTITRAAESNYKGVMIKTKTYIPPEYQGFANQLPTFLREKLYEEEQLKRPIKSSGPAIAFSMSPDHGDRYNGVHGKTENLPSISASVKHAFQFGGSMKETNKYRLGATDGFKKTESNDFPYLSPKARQQLKSESVPILMSNVFLTGMINPDGLTAQSEATIEHIITEHHAKTKLKPKDEFFGKGEYIQFEQRSSKKKLDKITVAHTLAQQDKKKKDLEMSPEKKEPKNNMDKVGMKLKATVGHLRMERETKRKKVLDLMKTKNFNLFRPNTINNLHLLKDALMNE